MKFKKSLAVLLLLAQMLTLSVACTKKDPGESGSETNAPETEAPRTDVADDLPDVKFNGANFRFTVNPDERFELVQDDYSAEGTSGAVYDRNKRVESRFDVKITADVSSAVQGEWESQWVIQQLFLSNDYQYEVVDMWQRMSLELPGNYAAFYNWMEVPHINWDKPWWNKESNEGSTFNNKMWTTTGSLSLTSLMYTYVLGYNVDLFEEFNINNDELMKTVFDGNWTLDKMIETASLIHRDDGDGIPSTGDTYGYGSIPAERTVPWVTAFGAESLVANDDDTKIVSVLGTEKVYNALEKMVNLTWTNKSSFATTGTGEDPMPYFINGNIGMIVTKLMSCMSSFADLDFEYGLLPLPKYDAAQADYYTEPYHDFSVFAIAANIPDDKLEMVGVIMEALNAESWKTVYPAYYDEALKGRYSTDETMADMIDLIVDGVKFDFAQQCAIWLRCKVPFLFDYCIRDNTTDLASVLAEGQANLDEMLPFIRTFYDDDFTPPPIE